MQDLSNIFFLSVLRTYPSSFLFELNDKNTDSLFIIHSISQNDEKTLLQILQGHNPYNHLRYDYGYYH